MSIRKRGNAWYIDFRFQWERYRLKSPDNSMAGAKVYESTIRQKLARGEKIENNTQTKVDKKTIIYSLFAEDWLEKYARANNKRSEFVNKTSMLKHTLLPFFGKYPIDKITNRLVEEFKAEKVKSGLSPKTINNFLTVLRKSLNTAQEWELIEHVPRIKLLRVDPSQTKFLSPEDCQKLLEHCDELSRDIIYFTLNTGLRFGEVTAVMWQDIDLARRILTIQRALYRGQLGSTKTNKIRKIPMNEGLVNLLTNMKRKSTGFIFTNRAGLPFIHTHCDKMIKKAAKRAGLPKIGWHTLRHTFASNLANNGVAVQQIQALLGHTDIKTTMRYSHIAPASLVEAVNKLDLGDNFGHNVVTSPFSPRKNREEILKQIVQNSA